MNTNTVLIFGGATEGKLAAKALESANINYIYSTKTPINFTPETFGTYRYGAFSEEELIDFCLANQIKIIIHASHPFAVELHKTIEKAAQELLIPVIRYERTFPERIKNALVKYFISYEEAIKYLIQNNTNNLLALTGVQTIERLKPYWVNHHTIFRILPRESSSSIAEQAGFPKENLLLQMPSDNIEDEVSIIKTHHIQSILTKESGESGFLTTKIEAAIGCKIPILIIEKPPIPASFIPVYNQQELLLTVKSLELAVKSK